MMFASHYMSEWTSVLFLYEMPIRSGVCAKSRAGSGFVVARICARFVRDSHCWRSKDRRYEGQVELEVNGGRYKFKGNFYAGAFRCLRFRLSIFCLQFLRGEK